MDLENFNDDVLKALKKRGMIGRKADNVKNVYADMEDQEVRVTFDCAHESSDKPVGFIAERGFAPTTHPRVARKHGAVKYGR